MSLTPFLSEYLSYLEIERGRSPKTVENYHRYLTRFFVWAKVSAPVGISEERVRAFRLWLNRQRLPSGEGLARVTQNYYLIALRNFLRYLERRGIRALSPERIELARTPERVVPSLSDDELERLLSAPAGGSAKAIRDRTMLELFFATGLRVSELLKLKVADIDLSRGEFSVLGKGGKARVVFISAAATRALRAWVESRHRLGILSDFFFVSVPRGKPFGKAQGKREAVPRGSPLTARSVERIVEFYAAKAGISGKRVSPHTLRHAFATDLLRSGADIRSVQALLGHKNISTTQVYTHVTDTHLKEVHRAFHGRRRQRRG